MSQVSTSEPVLTEFADGVWIASQPHSFLGLQLGTRMTVVRLGGSALLVHSPIALSSALRDAIRAKGEVAHVVVPNLFHHVFAGELQRAWPEAKLHAPRGLDKKRRDLRVDATLGSGSPEADWTGTLEPLPVDGSELRETVFFHAPSRTIISSDLTENFSRMDHLPTRLYLKASGTWQKPGWPLPLRVVYRDRPAARRSIDAILERDFDRVILAHGDPLERDGKAAVRSTFEFLR